MARKQGLKSQAKRLAARGRNGDDRLAHLSADEIAVLNSLQGGESINPDTGLPEYFSLKKVLKSAAKAAGALVGSYLGGPAGAAVGGGVVSALMGDSAKKALTTGLLSGLGAWGVQQTGVGDSLGIESLGSNADLLGRTAAAAAPDAIQTASGSSGGTGGGISALLPLLGLGAAAAGAAGTKTPKTKTPERAPDQEAVEYEPLDRDQLAYAGDPYSYGVFGPEFQYFNEVNPNLQPLTMRAGGRVGYASGGATEARDPTGPHGATSGGSGPKGGGKGGGGGGRKSDEPPHAGTGGGQTSGLGNRGPLGGLGNGGKGGMGDIDSYLDSLGVGTTPTTPSAPGVRPEIKRTGHWDNPDWDLKDWGAAMNKYKQRGAGWGFLDILGGPFVDVKPPDWDVPESFEDGDWHTSTNIGGVVGTLGSLFTGVPFGGVIGSKIDDYLGVPDLYHGSWSLGHDIQDENTMNPSGGGRSSGAGGGSMGGGGTGKNVGISQIVPRLPVPVPSKTATAAPGDAQDDQTSNNGVDDQTGRVYQPLPNPYTYGLYDPEHAFFTGQLPMTELDMARGGHVAGPGDGQSDSIPAMLSNGEYVIDAETVSALGDGSTDAGAKKLDQMRHRIRKHKRGAKASKIPPKAKGLSSYMKEAA